MRSNSKSMRPEPGSMLPPVTGAVVTPDHAAQGVQRGLHPAATKGSASGWWRPRDITASSPDEKDAFFAPSADKIYRHPTFYEVSDDVPHM